MTQSDFNHIVESLGALSPEQILQLRHELDAQFAVMTEPVPTNPQGSLGAMRDAADELDAIVEQAMRNRQERPWRLPIGE